MAGLCAPQTQSNAQGHLHPPPSASCTTKVVVQLTKGVEQVLGVWKCNTSNKCLTPTAAPHTHISCTLKVAAAHRVNPADCCHLGCAADKNCKVRVCVCLNGSFAYEPHAVLPQANAMLLDCCALTPVSCTPKVDLVCGADRSRGAAFEQGLDMCLIEDGGGVGGQVCLTRLHSCTVCCHTPIQCC
jgi:hypothetical protein